MAHIAIHEIHRRVEGEPKVHPPKSIITDLTDEEAADFLKLGAVREADAKTLRVAKAEQEPDEDDDLGDLVVEHQGGGRFKILESGEPLESGIKGKDAAIARAKEILAEREAGGSNDDNDDQSNDGSNADDEV
jgi:hypothetical protein